MGKGIFFSIPAHGHVNPALPMVRELVGAGEEIVFYGREPFREAVEETGARFRAYPPTRFRTDTRAGRGLFRSPPHPFRLAALLMMRSLALVPQLLKEVEEERFDYVIFDSLAPWGRYIAQRLGLPAVSSCVQLAFDRMMFRRQWPLPARLGSAIRYLPALLFFVVSALLLKLRCGVRGCRLIDVFAGRGDLNIIHTSREFQPAAERFDDSYCFVGRSFPPPAGTGGDVHRRPLAFVSLGTIHSGAPRFFRSCFGELEGLCRRVVITVARNIDPADLEPVPDGFEVVSWISQHDLLALLSRADIFVSHGSITSVSEGLYHGVPHVLCPQTREQEATAGRVQELGAGVMLGARPEAGALRSAVERVLRDPGFAASARKLGETLRRAGGGQRAAREILDFVARG